LCGDPAKLMELERGGGSTAEDVGPLSGLPELQTVGGDSAVWSVLLEEAGFYDGDRVEGGWSFERDFKPGRGVAFVADPIAVEVVVVCEVGADGVGAAAGEGRLCEGEVWCGDGHRGLQAGSWAWVLPQLADLREPADGVFIESSVGVGRDVEDQIAVSLVEGDEPLVDDLPGGTKLLRGVVALPEPFALEGGGGLGGNEAVGGDLLAGVLLVLADVGVVERGAWILAGVVVGDQTVGLELLDVIVDLAEGKLVVGDARPGGVPAVEDHGCDLAVVGEELGELCLDQLDLAGSDLIGPDIGAKIEDGEVEAGLESVAAERVDVGADDVVGEGRVFDAWAGGCGGPETEAVVMLGGETAIGHAGRTSGLRPLVGVEMRGVEELRRGFGVAPLALLEGSHVEVEVHAEAEV